MTACSKLFAATTLLASLSACQTTPPRNPDLMAARSAVWAASADPRSARASVELDAARQALQRAEAAWADRHDVDETRHLAYLAQRRADITLAVAARTQADERLQRAGAEREQVLLQARTREADQATQAARAAQANAQNAQAAAQSAQIDADAARQQAQQQADRAAALERDLQALAARSTQRGMVVTLGDVLFATGQATLQPGALRAAQQLASVLQQYPERRVLIEGFTDNQGGAQMNLELSQRRAEAFKQALVAASVAPGRIDVQAHGEADPVADNNTAAGRQQNRRVEILFSNGEGRFAGR